MLGNDGFDSSEILSHVKVGTTHEENHQMHQLIVTAKKICCPQTCLCLLFWIMRRPQKD